VIILGVDPGSRVTGYGVVRVQGSRLVCLEYGGLGGRTGAGAENFPARLAHIYRRLKAVVEQYSPQVMAVEDVFYSVNPKSVLKLGHARGVILLAAGESRIPLAEYSPLEVKKAVVGYGRASKDQIQMMVGRILGLKEKPTPLDAADALAIALCHAFNGSFRSLESSKFGSAGRGIRSWRQAVQTKG